MFLKMLQEYRAVIRNAHDLVAAFWFSFRQGNKITLLEFAFFIRNRIAMRVIYRVTEDLRQLINEFVIPDMFQLFCNLMYLVPAKSQLLCKIGFPDPVPSYNAQ